MVFHYGLLALGRFYGCMWNNRRIPGVDICAVFFLFLFASLFVLSAIDLRLDCGVFWVMMYDRSRTRFAVLFFAFC